MQTARHSAVEVDLGLQTQPSRNKRKRASDLTMSSDSKESRRLDEFQHRSQKRAQSGFREALQSSRSVKERGGPPYEDIANQAQLATPQIQGGHGGHKRRGRRSISRHAEPSTHMSQDPSPERIHNILGQVGSEGDMQYQHLASVSRHIPRHVIDSKWESLSTNAVDMIVQILRSDEQSVVMRLRDERKRTYASTAIQMVIQRLRSKMIRGLPFPPTTQAQREEDFDYEKIFDRCKALNAQLQPLLASVILLKDKIDDEIALLELEKTALEQLERNAKVDERTKQSSAGLHSILQGNDEYAKSENIGTYVNLVDQKQESNSLDAINDDSDLYATTDELYSHLESIVGNLKQAHGIRPAIDRNRSIIREVLVDYLDSDQFVHVLLG